MLTAALALAGCGEAPAPPDRVDPDPVMAAVLEAPLMTDPDLSLSNGRNLAAGAAGPIDGSLPDLAFGPDEAAAAQAAALRQTGARVRAPAMLPAPSPRLRASREESFVRRAALLVDRGDCGERLRPGFERAADRALPPLYPRSHLVAAAGSSDPACRLVAASVLTPVQPAGVIAYYHARMKSAGFRDAASQADDAFLLEGVRADSRFAVLIRPAGPGVTRIDLVSVTG